MLFSYPNVWNTCLLILQSRGYWLFLVGDPDETRSISHCTWAAEKDGMTFRADNPIELLGLTAIFEHQQPVADTPYWWRLEGDDVIATLEAEWRLCNA